MAQTSSNTTAKDGMRGFTLVEVMVAMGILAFGILAIASMQTASLGGTSKANFVTEATSVAMNNIEQLIPLSWNNALAASGVSNVGIYTITTTVTPDTPIPNNTMTITVQVDWEEKGVAKVPVSLTYIKNRLGP
jgi:type IV pilus assembly protein PilV